MPTVILKKKPLYFSCKKKLWNGKFTDYGKGLDIKMRNRNYFNNNNMQKGIALATCMAIVMGLFTGCGNKNDQQIAASPDEVQKGRYVETELSLPEEWKDKNISQIFRSGDELHFLVAGGSEGQVSLEEWMRFPRERIWRTVTVLHCCRMRRGISTCTATVTGMRRALPHICGRKRTAVRWILHHRSGWSLWIWMAIGSMIRRSM